MRTQIGLQASLKTRYAVRAALGRSWPLAAQQKYLAANFELDRSKNLRLDRQGVPIPRRIENFYFYLGMPLPSEALNERAILLQSELRKKFPRLDEFFPNQPEKFHVTLFDYRWQFNNPNPTPHPLLRDPQTTSAFVNQVAGLVRLFGPVTAYFQEFALFETGALIACGYPLTLPEGINGPSQVDLMRERFIEESPGRQGTAPDIFHLSIGRFLAPLSRQEHQFVWEVIDHFNSLPPITVVFDRVRVLYEKRMLLSSVRELGTIDL